MECTACPSPSRTKKMGKDRKGNQRFRCLTCRKTFSERPVRPLGAMQLPLDKALLCLNLLCEGNGVRSIERIVGVDKKTILKLLVQVGEGCERMLTETIHAVPVQDVQADELWTFVHAKQGTCTRQKIANPDAGDAYCFFGIERTSKLILAWHLGRRNGWDAHDFMEKLDKATTGKFQLSTDGFNGYPNAVEYNLGARVDYAQVIKEFGNVGGEEGRRYAPPRLTGQEKIVISGTPDEDRICTSHVERSNWTLRGHLRRFTRLSNGFSRKKSNLRAALALYFAYYNFVRMHRSIRMTPAMKAGIARKPWSLADLLGAAQATAA
ncbi:MAG TPA: IS1 family transposase [Thermoanaerobaculia bacterium]|nr:IS1 family transposase [Thermoanaerobaculia bacterium]